MRLSFGKYRGKQLENVPPDYLHWYLDEHEGGAPGCQCSRNHRETRLAFASELIRREVASAQELIVSRYREEYPETMQLGQRATSGSGCQSAAIILSLLVITVVAIYFAELWPQRHLPTHSHTHHAAQHHANAAKKS